MSCFYFTQSHCEAEINGLSSPIYDSNNAKALWLYPSIKATICEPDNTPLTHGELERLIRPKLRLTKQYHRATSAAERFFCRKCTDIITRRTNRLPWDLKQITVNKKGVWFDFYCGYIHPEHGYVFFGEEHLLFDVESLNFLIECRSDENVNSFQKLIIQLSPGFSGSPYIKIIPQL